MNISKRLTATFLCVIIAFSCIISVSAADTPKITVSNVQAAPGESVKVDIAISDNPGIMAMAFCITYDTDALSYKGYKKGYLTSYSVYPHEDKGHVSFINIESKDIAKNGNMLSILFDVKSGAAPGKYVISLANSNRDKYGTRLHNSFSNSQQEFVMVAVTSGSVTVAETCENSGHTYGEWNVVKESGCTQEGLKERVCSRCDNVEQVVLPIEHNFEIEWTVDKPATPAENGIMSHHCANCDEVADVTAFEFGDTDGDNKVTGKDCVCLMQYINGGNATIVETTADINCDGKLNSKDYVLLVRYLNGWNV